MIAHFKLVMDGIQVPAGEVYSVHRGGQRRARLLPRLRRQRPAVQASACARRAAPCWRRSRIVTKDALLADLVPTFDTINMIGGEVEQ